MFASMLRRSAATARRAAPTARFAGLRSGAMLAGAVGVGAGCAHAPGPGAAHRTHQPNRRRSVRVPTDPTSSGGRGGRR